jgi:hypothetical protein
VPDKGHVFSAMTLSQAELILAEGDIEHPVQAIFNLPVVGDGESGLRRGQACGGDEEACVEAAAVFQFGARSDLDDGLGSRQSIFDREASLAIEPIGFGGDGDKALFDTTMGFVEIVMMQEAFGRRLIEIAFDFGNGGTFPLLSGTASWASTRRLVKAKAETRCRGARSSALSWLRREVLPSMASGSMRSGHTTCTQALKACENKVGLRRFIKIVSQRSPGMPW